MTSASHSTAPLDLVRHHVLLRDDWLPTDSPFPELNELGQEHRQLLADLRAVGQRRSGLQSQYEAEDAEYLRVQRQAYVDGVKKPKLPTRTAQATRDKALSALDEEGATKKAILVDMLRDTLRTIESSEAEWLQDLDQHERTVEQRIQDLERQLVAERASVGVTAKLRDWIQRTARPMAYGYLHYGYEVPSTDMLTIANQGRTKFNSVPSPALEQEHSGQAPDDEALDTERYWQQREQALKDHAANAKPGNTGEVADLGSG